MKTYVFVLAALASGAVMAQNTSSTACAPQLTHLQERLYQKAGEGPDALRDFVFIRRGILQLDGNSPTRAILAPRIAELQYLT